MRRISESADKLPRRTSGVRARVSTEKRAFAKGLRRRPSTAFDLLWRQLRKEKLGVRFRRRAILYGWIPDFWCPAARVAVEIDYPSDAARVEEHRRRDRVLASRAITVLRFPAERIYSDASQVAREIGAVIADAPRQGPARARRARDAGAG